MSNDASTTNTLFDAPEGDMLDAVAIIGMAGRFPGARNIEEFWQNLRDGVESIAPLSLGDMLDAGVDPAVARDPHRVAAASTLADIEYFDAGFFDFSPRQAELTDPQHRLFLECAWEALECAGYDPAAYPGAIGVFAGSSISTYLLFNLYPSLGYTNASSDLQTLIGNDKDYLATQVAYKLNLKGPAINVQTACSTSLVAIHLACQSLLSRECDMALAGGVTVRIPARAGYLYQEGGILSPDGHCRPFDAEAQGTIFGSGMGMVVLKRLADALTDGDIIDAVIKGSAINNDGSLKAGYTAPSEDGQAAVIAEALAISGMGAETIGYVETHGTGTPLGDPIEVAALTRAFRAHANPRAQRAGSCALGAVKSNFGHLESAAGIAGLIKTVLALKHRQIPPTLHFTQPNTRIDFAQSPFYVNTQLTDWERGLTPRRACVSSFGIGGTNAHVVLEEAPGPVAGDTAPYEPSTERPYVLPVSARDRAALQELARAYQGFLADEASGAALSLRDICWSASQRRRHHDQRLAAVGRSRDELIAQLAAINQDQVGAQQPAFSAHPHKVVFVFPGQGPQWIGMGQQLLEREPTFRAVLEECDRVMRRHVGWSLLAMLQQQDESQGDSWETDVIQLVLFAIQAGLAALWRSWGIEPDAVVGHSMGEVAAAYVGGALSLEDAVRVLYHRNRLIQRVWGKGQMMMVGLTLEQARELLAGYETQVSIAVSNSPKSTVLSGTPDAMRAIAAVLQQRGTFHRWIKVDFASHSPQVDALQDDLRQALQSIRPRKAAIPIVSTVTGALIDGTELHAGYWARNLREPVLFGDATRWLREHDYDAFLEISPHPSLLPSIEDSLYHLAQPGIVVPSLRRHADEQRSLLEALGMLYRAGQPVDWNRFYPQGGRLVRLPGYPWQRQRYWVDPPRHGQADTAPDGAPEIHPLLGRRLSSALKELQFESRLSLQATPYLTDHRVCGRAVFPATAYLELFWKAAAVLNDGPHEVTDVVLHDMLLLECEAQCRIQTILTPGENGEGTLQLFRLEKDTDTWRLHATGSVRTMQDECSQPPFELSDIQLRCARELSSTTYYSRLRAEGLEYGPGFRGIEALWSGDNEAVGRVRLPEVLAGEASAYAIHPALLDASLQLIGATFAGEGTAPAESVSGRPERARGLYLPVGIAVFRVYIPSEKQVWGHVRMQVSDETCETRTGDVYLYNEQGQLVAEVRGLRVKRVSRAALQQAVQGNLYDWFYEVQWQKKPLAPSNRQRLQSASSARRWLILADRAGVGQALAALLREQGETSTLVFPGERYQHDAEDAFRVDPARPEDFRKLLAEGSALYGGVIYLWGLDAMPLENTTITTLLEDEAHICGGALHLAQALVQEGRAASSRLYLVTRGAQAVETPTSALAVAQSPLWGLGRSIALEHPDLQCVRVDMDYVGDGENARSLLAEVRAGDEEDQVAFRHDERFAARLVRCAPASLPVGKHARAAARQSLQLTIPARGVLDHLALEPAERRAPGPGEVEIRVRATGLNFRDVLNALGMYPGDAGPLGLECAGEIAALGEGVDEFQVGDPVVALAQGAFCTFVTIPAVFVAKKPTNLSFVEAATIPIAFMTAYYGLCHLAGMRSGDKVLIHAAAGGLGLAATQLAKRAGAEVFATAGNEEKRNFLRSLGIQHIMNSRTLDFAAEVMEQTGGQGVDIVLNSLTGDYIPRNLSIVGTHGRFVEVGKIGVWDAGRMKQARPDVSYFVFDLGMEARQNPEVIGEMLRTLMREFERGALSPLPRRTFSLREATGAFRFMAQAKHIGKIVVTQEAESTSTVPDRFRADGSYLVTGGLGGLGLCVARWMVEQGARFLTLLGRGGASEDAQATIDELEHSGAQVLVIQADVSQVDQVARALETIGQAMPPLRGIVHAAGVLNDGILLRQDWERFTRVFAPKVQGAWNLHALTLNLPLDFFVFFSSIASIWGTAGQSNYAAANAFLDALAHTRRAQGRAALSINWGGWAEVGLAVRQTVTGRMTMQGVRAIMPEQGVQALEHAMYQNAAQIAILPIEWSTLLEQFPGGMVPPLLAEFSREAYQHSGGKQASPGQSELLRRLEETVPRNRRRVLVTYLYDQARLTLGLDSSFSLNPQQPLNEFGLDSLMAIELRSRLSNAVGRTLPATLLFDYPTVDGLAEYLARDVLRLPLEETQSDGADGGSSTTTARQADGQDSVLADIQQLPQDELEALLAEELAAVQSLFEVNHG